MSPFALYGLLGAVVGVAALSSSGGSSGGTASAPASGGGAPLPQGGGPGGGAYSQGSRILAAVAVALRTETDPSNLRSFAAALSTLGYASAAAKLTAKAGTLGASLSTSPSSAAPLGSVLTGPPDASGAPTSVAVQYVPPGAVALASGYVMGKGGAVGRIDGQGNFVPTGGGQAIGQGGAPVDGSSEFGESGLDPSNPEDLPYWVNLYAKASLKTGQTPSSAQVSAAVKAALSSYGKESGKSLTDFYNVLLAYGYEAQAEQIHSVAVLPFFVLAYSGSKSWSPTEIDLAALKAQEGQQVLFAETAKGIVPAKSLSGYPLGQENLAYAMLDFANVLWSSSAFGRSWKAQAQGLAWAASNMFGAAGLPEAAAAVSAETPGQWTT